MRKELSLVLGDEKNIYIIILIYTIFIGIASISIPISIQALVNIIPSTAMYYPLVLLSFVLLILLGISSVVYGMQKYVIELFKRRIFVRITSLMVTRALYFEKKTMQSTNSEQIFDRFFEIPNIQSSLPNLLVGIFTAVVQMVSAIIICSFYHPILLAFNVALVLIIYGILRYHGSAAIKTAIKESTAKYETASWIAEVGRKYLYLKSGKAREYVSKKANNIVANYITARKKHFRYLFTQIVGLLILYAFGNVLLLFVCGALVLEEKLTLGQFVATEVFFSYTFGHVLIFGNYLESFYKLVASCNKLAMFYKIPLEDHTNKDSSFEMNNINISNVTMPSVSSLVNLHIELDGSYNIFMNFHERTKGFLLALIMGWEDDHHGKVQIDGKTFNEINLDKYRDKIAFIDSSNILCTNIKEYVVSCNPAVSHTKFEAVIKLVGLYDTIQSFPEKERTEIISSKYPLNKEEVVKLKLAKALIEENKLIIFDYPILDHILRENKQILEHITNEPTLTIIHFTENNALLTHANNIYRFDPQVQSIIKQHV
jgi:putative ABC transport system ATP-binding protein